ncbi:hypothetical protein BJF79_13610 [Actinomadura sp. CNU-125]|uniref:hypothetical protein n=1 Tax=Actinomadura sp. CNU-125 TaxID=1904961 RepID=UPI0009682BEB|nr:hypothetical protein [Actinomadura sp. CNU-125]OLT24374.1 hypothetical protein BJF79_13610 [Actinomadura sp. CNU-125]
MDVEYYTVNKPGVIVPVSRELLLDHGLVEPTPVERAERERRAAEWRQRAEEHEARRAAAREALAAITAPVARIVLDLHVENPRGECGGDDMDGYDAEFPEWPCRTVEKVAAHYGISF